MYHLSLLRVQQLVIITVYTFLKQRGKIDLKCHFQMFLGCCLKLFRLNSSWKRENSFWQNKKSSLIAYWVWKNRQSISQMTSLTEQSLLHPDQPRNKQATGRGRPEYSTVRQDRPGFKPLSSYLSLAQLNGYL